MSQLLLEKWGFYTFSSCSSGWHVITVPPALLGKVDLQLFNHCRCEREHSDNINNSMSGDILTGNQNIWTPYRESCVHSVVVGIEILLKFQNAEFHFFQEPIRYDLWKWELFACSCILHLLQSIVWTGNVRLLTVSVSINSVGHSEHDASIWEDLRNFEPNPLRPSPR